MHLARFSFFLYYSVAKHDKTIYLLQRHGKLEGTVALHVQGEGHLKSRLE